MISPLNRIMMIDQRSRTSIRCKSQDTLSHLLSALAFSFSSQALIKANFFSFSSCSSAAPEIIISEIKLILSASQIVL